MPTQPDQVQPSPRDLDKARAQGAAAFAANKPRESCPYQDPSSSTAWTTGWDRAQAAWANVEARHDSEGADVSQVEPVVLRAGKVPAVQVLSVDLHRPWRIGESNRCNARVRLVLPKYKLVASCKGEADGPVLDMLIAHGLRGDENVLRLLGVGDRAYVPFERTHGAREGFIERSAAGFMLCRPAGDWAVVGDVEHANRGRLGMPYDACGAPHVRWCADSLTSAIWAAYGDGSDAGLRILAEIQSSVDAVARGLAPLGCIEPAQNPVTIELGDFGESVPSPRPLPCGLPPSSIPAPEGGYMRVYIEPVTITENPPTAGQGGTEDESIDMRPALSTVATAKLPASGSLFNTFNTRVLAQLQGKVT